jgi:hypothetical protein
MEEKRKESEKKWKGRKKGRHWWYYISALFNLLDSVSFLVSFFISSKKLLVFEKWRYS